MRRLCTCGQKRFALVDHRVHSQTTSTTSSKITYRMTLAVQINRATSEFKKTLTLSEDESEMVSRFKTDAERQAYIHSLTCTQETMRQLAIEAGITNNQSGSE